MVTCRGCGATFPQGGAQLDMLPPALRQAAAAFGPAGVSVDLASPATPEAVYWAVEQAREHTAHGHVDEGSGAPPPQPGTDAHPMRPSSEQILEAAGHG